MGAKRKFPPASASSQNLFKTFLSPSTSSQPFFKSFVLKSPDQDNDESNEFDFESEQDDEDVAVEKSSVIEEEELKQDSDDEDSDSADVEVVTKTQSQLIYSSKSTETSTRERPLFNAHGPSLQVKKSIIGMGRNIILSRNAQEPVMSERSRDRAKEIIGYGMGSTKNTDNKKEWGSKTEVIKRENESQGIDGDKSLVRKHFKGAIRLWCLVCLSYIGANKKETSRHLETKKHSDKLNDSKNVIKQKETLKSILLKHRIAHPDEKGQTISEQDDLFRIETVKAFMGAGIELNKIDDLRPYLEGISGKSLTGRSHLTQYIPIIASEEVRIVKKAVKDQLILCCFDTSTRVDNVMDVIFRVVAEDFTIDEYLAALEKYTVCKSGEQYGAAVHSVLQSYDIDMGGVDEHGNPRIGNVVATQRDRAATNNVAIDILNNTCIGSDDLHCVSHTIVHVGEHMPLIVLKPFFEDLKALMNSQGGANKGRVLWRMIFLSEWVDPGNTRWWAVFEVYVFLDNEFNKLVDFVERSADPIGTVAL